MNTCIVCDEKSTSTVDGFDLCGVHYTAVWEANNEKKRAEEQAQRAADRERFKNLYPHIKMGPR